MAREFVIASSQVLFVTVCVTHKECARIHDHVRSLICEPSFTNFGLIKRLVRALPPLSILEAMGVPGSPSEG